MASVEIEASPIQVEEKSSEEKVAAPEQVTEVEAAAAPEDEIPVPAEVETKEPEDEIPVPAEVETKEVVEEDAEEIPPVVEGPAAAKEAEPPKAGEEVPIEKTEE